MSDIVPVTPKSIEVKPNSKYGKLLPIVQKIAQNVKFLTSQQGDLCISVNANGIRRIYLLESTLASEFLVTYIAYSFQKILNKSDIDTIKALLRNAMIGKAPKQELFRRIYLKDGMLHYVLDFQSNRVCQISSDKIEIIENSDDPIVNLGLLLPQVEPSTPIPFKDFEHMFNISLDDFWLLMGWMTYCLYPQKTYPLVMLNGEQGSGKTGLTKMIVGLLDPTHGMPMTFPHKDEDIFLVVDNFHLLAFDNLSDLTARLSDILCTIATGTSYARRKNYHDRELSLFTGVRPIWMNGITQLIERPDLASRTLTIYTKSIDGANRMTATRFEEEFEALHSSILATLMTTTAKAAVTLPDVSEKGLERMADFHKWLRAFANVVGLDQAYMDAIYEDNVSRTFDNAGQSNPVLTFLVHHIKSINGKPLTPAQILDKMREACKDDAGDYDRLPKNASELGKNLVRIKPILDRKGIAYSDKKTIAGRIYKFIHTVNG